MDTSFWVALRNRRDAHHHTAVALLHQHAEAGLITSTQVRGETWTFLRRRNSHAAAVGFLDALEKSPRISVLPIDAVLEQEALQWLRSRDERVYSFVDATSFALMRSRKILETLAFDGDFSAAGFVELRPH